MIKKIGLYDSGVGGLSVVSAVRKSLPQADLIYAADTYHVPYGGRPFEEIMAFSEGISRFLVSKGADAIIIACNVSSAVAASSLRKIYSIPIFSMIEFGAKAAAAAAASSIGILATEGTVKSEAYPKNLRALGFEGQIIQEACPEFVPFVESGAVNSSQCAEVCRKHCKAVAEADTIILGCTHYPFLSHIIKNILPCCKIIDPAVSLADALPKVCGSGSLKCWTTGTREKFEKSAGVFVSGITAEELVWEGGELFEKNN